MAFFAKGHIHFRVLCTGTLFFLCSLLAIGNSPAPVGQLQKKASVVASPTSAPSLPIGPTEPLTTWEGLDEARAHYLAGDLPAALLMLEDLAWDTLSLEPDLLNARRELTAFVLAASGQHERAFDSIRSFVHVRIQLLEQDHQRTEAELEAQIISLQDVSEQQQLANTYQLAEQRSVYNQQLIIGIGVIVFLLLSIVMLALQSRKTQVAEVPIPNPAPREVVPVKKIEAAIIEKPAPPPAPLPRIKGEPMDAAIMLDHASLISSQLSKGSTVEAAGHLGILLRFLRTVADQMKDGQLPAQAALAFIRQYMKLETHRTGSKLRYTVEADRLLLERGTPIPAMALLPVLSRVMDVADSDNGIVVAFSATVGDAAQCEIKYPLDPTTSTTANHVDLLDLPVTFLVDQHPSNDEMVVRIQWGASISGQVS